MLKKTIKYTDYNGNAREETFYFNLTKAEIAEMQLSTSGGLDEYITRIIQEQDTKEIAKIFKELICKAYGKKSDDGRRFMKSEEILKEFTETEAFSELYIELAGDADAANAFFNGIIPDVPEEAKPKVLPGPGKAPVEMN